jgi:hypothetical protein
MMAGVGSAEASVLPSKVPSFSAAVASLKVRNSGL